MTIADPRDAGIPLNDTIFSQFSMSHHCGPSSDIFTCGNFMPRCASHPCRRKFEFLESEVSVPGFPRSVRPGWSWVGQRVTAGSSLQHCIMLICDLWGLLLFWCTHMKPCLLSQVSADYRELFSPLQAHVASGHWQSKHQPLGEILGYYSQILHGKSKEKKGNTSNGLFGVGQ